MSNSEQTTNVLKFNYRGSLDSIVCSSNCDYNDIVAMVIKRFHILTDDLTSVQFKNENGYIFEPKLFEYFILLFPNPVIVFYVNRCYKKSVLKYRTIKLNTNSNKNNNNNNNKRQLEQDDDSYAAPVKRQNCFLGSLPAAATEEVPSSKRMTKNSNNNNNKRQREQDDDSYAAPVKRQNCFLGSLPAAATEEIPSSKRMTKSRHLNATGPIRKIRTHRRSRSSIRL